MKIGVVFGGCSYEHEISIISAVVIKKALSLQKEFIFIDKNKDFFLIPAEKMRAVFFSSGEYKKCVQLFLGKGGFYMKSLFSKKRLEVDVMLDLIHGLDGEDGKLAALFDFFDIKFIGPSLEASNLSFNKLNTKLYASLVGVKTLDFSLWKINEENKLDFPLPVILKPLHLGSSIGIGVVKSEDDLAYAKDVAYEFDDELLVEPFLANVKEYNLAGAMVDGKLVFSVIEEPKKRELFDFEQKYLSFKEELKSREADLDEDLKVKMKEAFARLYDPLFKGSLIRCDFFVHGGEVYINEINPVPGSLANYLFTDFSKLILALAKEARLSKKPVIDYAFIHSIKSVKK